MSRSFYQAALIVSLFFGLGVAIFLGIESDHQEVTRACLFAIAISMATAWLFWTPKFAVVSPMSKEGFWTTAIGFWVVTMFIDNWCGVLSGVSVFIVLNMADSFVLWTPSKFVDFIVGE